MKNCLNIGINHLNPANYAGWDGKLTGCVNDAKYMKSVIKPNGFNEILLNNKATYANFERVMLYMAQLSTEKDHTFITFSGHGASIPDNNNDEEDRKDETICLYDGMLRDDSYSKLIDMIRGKVYIISDSCHSGTNAKDMFFDSRIQDMREKVIKNVDVSKIKIKAPLQTRNNAPNVLTLASCEDHEVSYDFNTHGAFTEAIIKVIEKNKNINYINLTDETRKILKDLQHPKLSYWRGESIIKDIVFS